MAAAVDKHAGSRPGSGVTTYSPADDVTDVIVPHDTIDNILDDGGVAVVSKGLYVVTGGDIRFLSNKDKVRVLYSVPSGTTQLPARAKRILLTGTTASGIQAWI